MTVPDLLEALRRTSIRVETDDRFLRKAGVEPKSEALEAEFARQLAMTVCASLEGRPAVDLACYSAWNRFLPRTVAGPPGGNPFQKCQDEFDHAWWCSRGYILPEKVSEYVATELKRRKLEARAVQKYMKEKNVDEKQAIKAVVVKRDDKVEKGAPPRLGPAPYGLTDEFVDQRAHALDDLAHYMEDYFSAVDRLRQVEAQSGAAFVVQTSNMHFDAASAPVLPSVEHRRRLEGAMVPPQKAERPVVPPDPFAKKKKKGKKRQAEVVAAESSGPDTASLRCTQTKPFVA